MGSIRAMTVDKDKISKTLKIDFSYLTKNDMKSLDLRKLQSSLWRSQTQTGESAGGVPRDIPKMRFF